MTGDRHDHDEFLEDEQHERPEEESASAAMGEGLERVRRELERGRALARAREAAAEASRALAAEGEPDGAERAEAGPGDGTDEDAERRTDGGAERGTERGDTAGERGGAQAPAGGQASGEVRRSAAAERARRAVRRTGQRPQDASRAADESVPSGDGTADAGRSADAVGGDEERRSRGAERARQALKRAAPEARRAREEAYRPQPQETAQGGAETTEDGAGQTAVRRSAAAERARQAVSRTGHAKPRTEADGGDAGRDGADRADTSRTGHDRTEQDRAAKDRAAARRGDADRADAGPVGVGRAGGDSAAQHPKEKRPKHWAPAHSRPEASSPDAAPTPARPSARPAAVPSKPADTTHGLARVGNALTGARGTVSPPDNDAEATDGAEAINGADATSRSAGTGAATATGTGAASGRARVFPAVAAGAGDGAEFAETWWGRAWLDALESTALDTARLARGREYAAGGHVGRITVAPGRISAPVTGSRPYPYRAELRLRPFPDAVWEAFFDGVVARPAHLAALLGRTLPRALAERQDEAGVRLLPGPGDLVPRCSCPDRGHPCKHAAALCFQAARLLDADPFVLLLMRGRGERELLDELSRRNATHSAHTERATRATLPAVPARAVLHAQRELPPLPPPLPVPEHPGRPPVLPSADDPAIDPAAVELLAADAAARARACLIAAQEGATYTPGEDTPSPFPAPSLWEDAVRLVAGAHPTSGLTASTRELYRGVAEATGRPVTDVARAVAAWRQGGAEGLSLLETTWDPPAGDFDRARSALSAADLPALRPRHNHLTDAGRGIQLRFGRDGRWYPYESDPGTEDWWPTGRADSDPVGALTPLLTTE